jgi:acetylornithine deacetylase/succinyl-diaminopimelate desuccinylase-like protein
MSKLTEMLQHIDGIEDEIVSLEQELVRIPSVNSGFMPTGNETPVCEFIKKWLEEAEINSEILEAAPHRGNIIANLEGESEDLGLLFMSHTDVVPVEDEQKWTYPPFSAHLHNGRIYGRGASDCKGLLTSQLIAMKLLKKFDVRLRDTLSLISCADEEHGGRYGFGWLAQKHPEKLKAPYAVNEGGGVPIEVAGSLTYTLGVGEKGRLQVEIDITGTSAHASLPWQGENALYKLSKILERLENYEPELDTSTSFFQHLSTFAIEHKPSPENIDEIVAELEDSEPRLASMVKALSRMTITPTMINGGIKSNSVPEQIRLTCDVRTIPHQGEGYLRQELDKILSDISGVNYDIDYMAIPNSSDFETELMVNLQKATRESLDRDDIQFVPAISNGFTDSRFTRPLGVTTYGFSGTHPDDNPMLSNVHGTDESIGVKSLLSGAKIMLHLAYSMLAVDA